MQKKEIGVSSDVLKWIAVITMCIDHLAVVVLKGYVNTKLSEIPVQQIKTLEVAYDVMRNIGRTAFPLFAFLLVEGFYHTRNRKKYGMRLLVCALLSEIPYNLAIYREVWSPERQNILFTLLLGFLCLVALELLQQNSGKLKQIVLLLLQGSIIACACLLASVCRLDYSWSGILLIAVFRFFYHYRIAMAGAGFCVFSGSPLSFPAFLLILFYNGKRKRKARWLYWFYPMHLLLLWGILQILLWL